MSKKKSAIIDDDPLAWLKDEPTKKNTDVETAALDTVVEPALVESSAVDVPADVNRESNEENLIKEKTDDVDSNEDVLLADAEIDTDAELKTEGKDASNEALSVIVETDDAPQISENNEEDVAMATSNNEEIVLEEDVCIVQVAVLKEAWLPVLDSGKDININASAVEDIDTAGLQLLLSLVKTAKDSGRSVTWENPSEAVINAVKETSLRDALGIQI